MNHQNDFGRVGERSPARFFIAEVLNVGNGKNIQHDPYIQRCMKIIRAETAQETEAIVNALFTEAASSGGALPDVQITPSGDGYTIVIFNDFVVD